MSITILISFDQFSETGAMVFDIRVSHMHDRCDHVLGVNTQAFSPPEE